jgi:hypothetical protein
MHYLKRVQKSHPHDNLLAYFGCIIFVQKLIVLDELEKVFTLYELSDYVDVGLGLDALLEF